MGKGRSYTKKQRGGALHGGVSDGAKRFRGNPRRRNPLFLGNWGIRRKAWLSGLQGQARSRKRCCTSIILINPKRVSVMLGEMRCTACRARHIHSHSQIFCDIPPNNGANGRRRAASQPSNRPPRQSIKSSDVLAPILPT